MLTTCPRAMFLLGAVLFAEHASAGAATLAAAADSAMFSESGDLSNGRGEHLFVGVTAGGARRRALLSFDLTLLPAGARITSAVLEMSATRVAGGAIPVSVHRVLGSWGEGASNAGDPGGGGAAATVGDATWVRRSWPGTSWIAAGADATTSPSATTAVETQAVHQWSGAGLVADLQSWVDQPSGNFGWLLRSNESGVQNAKRFGSRESTQPANRPRLTVEFDSPQGPAQPAAVISLWDDAGRFATILLVLCAGLFTLAKARSRRAS